MKQLQAPNIQQLDAVSWDSGVIVQGYGAAEQKRSQGAVSTDKNCQQKMCFPPCDLL